MLEYSFDVGGYFLGQKHIENSKIVRQIVIIDWDPRLTPTKKIHISGIQDEQML